MQGEFSHTEDQFVQSLKNLLNENTLSARSLQEHIELAQELLAELHARGERTTTSSAANISCSATPLIPRNRTARPGHPTNYAALEPREEIVIPDSDEEETISNQISIGAGRNTTQLVPGTREDDNGEDSDKTLDLNFDRNGEATSFTALEQEGLNSLLGNISRRHFSRDKSERPGIKALGFASRASPAPTEKLYEDPFLSSDVESDVHDPGSGRARALSSGSDDVLIVLSSEDEFLRAQDDDDADDDDDYQSSNEEDPTKDWSCAGKDRKNETSDGAEAVVESRRKPGKASVSRRVVPSIPRTHPTLSFCRKRKRQRLDLKGRVKNNAKRRYPSEEHLSEDILSGLESLSDDELWVADETSVSPVQVETAPKKKQKCSSPASDASEPSTEPTTDRSAQDPEESTNGCTLAGKTPTPTDSGTLVISSEDDDDSIPSNTEVAVKTEAEAPFGRKNIREVISKAQLSKATREANLREKDRRKRIEENQRIYNQVEIAERRDGEEVRCVLEFDLNTEEPSVQVHPQLSKRMKAHQVDGVKFMYQNLVESAAKLQENSPGTGAILGHCMGLGKTFQVVCLLHTLMTHPKLKAHFSTVLVVSPLNVIPTWQEEISRWVQSDPEITEKLTQFTLHKATLQTQRLRMLNEWQESGGIMIMTPNLLTKLLGHETQAGKLGTRPKQFPDPRATERFKRFLCDPGPQLLIVDEGHTLKKDTSQLTQIVDKMIKTSRKLLLTGTPLQNNLIEYYTMVSVVSPHLLGTKTEYRNRFENPIMNGQYRNSTEGDIRMMRKRASVLRKVLENVVHRRDLPILQSMLPPRRDYVVTLRLSTLQEALYERFLGLLTPGAVENGQTGLKRLLQDFISLRSVWTHPKLLTMPKKILRRKKTLGTTVADALGFDSISPVAGAARDTGSDWFESFIEHEDLDNLALGPKLFILREIIEQCGVIGDKLVVFCTQLSALDLIEFMLGLMHRDSNQDESWTLEEDYFRMDGSTSAEDRQRFFEMFNNPANTRARLFLVSTNAGKLGSTLIGANRMVLLDTSWNPADDNQAVYRIYRIGQTKPVFIYRFVSFGTMEEKIYARNILKESTSYRVLDDSNKERHFTHEEVRDLYTFASYDESERQTPSVPQDKMLAELILRHPDLIIGVHEHQQMLQNLEDDLSEEDRRIAWNEYQREKERAPPNPVPAITGFLSMLGISPDMSSIIERKTVDSSAEFWKRSEVTDAERLGIAPKFRNAATRCREHLLRVRTKTQAMVSDIIRRGQLNEYLKQKMDQKMGQQISLFEAEDAELKGFISEIDKLIQSCHPALP